MEVRRKALIRILCCLCHLLRSRSSGGTTNIKDLIIICHEMGFEDELIERALLYGECKSIEEAMYFCVPNQDGLWEHKFVPEEYVKPQDYCLFCKRKHKNKKNLSDNGFSNNSPSDKSISMFGDRQQNNFEKSPFSEKPDSENGLVVKLKDKLIKNNKLLLRLASTSQKEKESASIKNSQSNSAKSPLQKLDKTAAVEDFQNENKGLLEDAQNDMTEMLLSQELSSSKKNLIKQPTF